MRIIIYADSSSSCRACSEAKQISSGSLFSILVYSCRWTRKKIKEARRGGEGLYQVLGFLVLVSLLVRGGFGIVGTARLLVQGLPALAEDLADLA